jgi:uncharacterized protein (TIGR02266 family)
MTNAFDTLPPPSVQKTARHGVRVAVAVDAVSEHNFWSDVTLDVVRSGGVFVATYHALPLGTVVDVELAIGDGDPAHAKGVVIWTRAHGDGVTSPGLGIAFSEIPPEVQANVELFVEKIRQPLLFEAEYAPRKRASRPSMH